MLRIELRAARMWTLIFIELFSTCGIYQPLRAWCCGAIVRLPLLLPVFLGAVRPVQLLWVVKQHSVDVMVCLWLFQCCGGCVCMCTYVYVCVCVCMYV